MILSKPSWLPPPGPTPTRALTTTTTTTRTTYHHHHADHLPPPPRGTPTTTTTWSTSPPTKPVEPWRSLLMNRPTPQPPTMLRSHRDDITWATTWTRPRAIALSTDKYSDEAAHERHGLRAQVQKCNDNCTVGYLFASEAHVTPHGHHHYLPPGTFPPEFHPTNTTIPLRHTTHTPPHQQCLQLHHQPAPHCDSAFSETQHLPTAKLTATTFRLQTTHSHNG